jgi:hypothetical protein
LRQPRRAGALRQLNARDPARHLDIVLSVHLFQQIFQLIDAQMGRRRSRGRKNCRRSRAREQQHCPYPRALRQHLNAPAHAASLYRGSNSLTHCRNSPLPAV